uniref:Uncharacterized protein n=1 Tax=Chromera velia CCMP2878 TaxID=1169474 RepID=A0A0G4FW21_9ALVE|eukprot:Cvel_18918.t1-p1 / transcript=Cvel_18918.t1 / gene=Cvel_18918 / organism=Chromera_velia_CCMP2878 / gene_product=Radial spoke head protein 4 homolog A, putative / transcript_product=Radial spoke head protein 4 homolog A, putative / location=Cvel_scaffold1595:10002-17175(+) / protein_length=462 / sequence_SO=supercontig / SO=protein_coding / is_pseudo=false
MSADITFEQAQALLKKDSGGKNLYSHLVSLLAKIAKEKPEDAYETFESMSRYLKEGGFKLQTAPHPSSTLPSDPAFKELQKQWIETTISLTNNPKEEGDDSALAEMPDWLAQANMFAWAGVGFSRQETYEIHCSLRRFAATTEGLQSVRFWGKLLGTEADYLVAEGRIDGGDDGEREDIEPRGTGANKFTYWVAKDAKSPWTILPDAAPNEIQVARQIKKVLTGDLTRPVITHPHFPGTEKQLVRAIIALITADTVICPRGYFRTPEDSEDVFAIEKDPEYEFPSAADLGSLETWTHCREFILHTGKCNYPEVDEENEELAAKVAAMKEEDPVQEVLRGLDADKPVIPEVEGAEAAWGVQKFGDPCKYTQEGGEGETAFTVTAVTSLKWPGAMTVSQGKSFASVYIGYGHAAGVPSFFPPAPAEIQDEPVDGQEQPEPHPLEEDDKSDKLEEDPLEEGADAE